MELNKFVGKYKECPSNAQYREPSNIDTEITLNQLRLARNHKFFKALLKHHAVKAHEAQRILSPNVLDLLVTKRIISLHPNRTYTFNSRCIEAFFRGA